MFLKNRRFKNEFFEINVVVDLMMKVRLAADAHLRSRLADHVMPWSVTYFLILYLGRTAVIGWTWLPGRGIRAPIRQRAQLLIDLVLREMLKTWLKQRNQVLIFICLFFLQLFLFSSLKCYYCHVFTSGFIKVNLIKQSVIFFTVSTLLMLFTVQIFQSVNVCLSNSQRDFWLIFG